MTTLLAITFGTVSCASRPSSDGAAVSGSALQKAAEDCLATSIPDPRAPSEFLPFSAIILQVGDVVCLVPASKEVWKAAPRVAAQSRHVEIRMMTEGRKTIVACRNGTQTSLRYRAAMQIDGNPNWEETSIVPVMPGLVGYEMWPHPIDALAVFDIHAE